MSDAAPDEMRTANGSDRFREDESWKFALKVYGEPGVAHACLSLQAEAGIDVMMMLVAAYTAARCDYVLSSTEISEMNALCRPWRVQVVQPLRVLRSALKAGPAPAPGPDTDTLRAQIKRCELAAERLQNDLLLQWVQIRLPASRGADENGVRLVVSEVILFALGGREALITAEMAAAVDRIVTAINSVAA